MKLRQATLVFLIALIGCAPRAPDAPVAVGPQPQSLATIQMKINDTPFTLQVADNDATREVGLMYVHQMPAERGMIFVFPVERPLSFWMKNTPIDLDIIYADADRKVVSVKTMHAYDTTPVPSEAPASYAIELNAGIAARARVSVGQVLDIPSELAAKAR